MNTIKKGKYKKCAYEHCNNQIYVIPCKWDKEICCSKLCANLCKTDSKLSKIRTCAHCKIEFTVKFKNSPEKFCSKTCSAARLKKGIESNCKNCGNLITIAPWEAKANKECCSAKCRSEYKSKKCIRIISCEICGNEFNTNKSEVKHGRRFCSIKCLNRYRSQKSRESIKVKNTKPELKFAKILNDNNIKHIPQYWIPWKRGWKKFYDFYIPEINLLIEIDGIYWHGKGLEDSKLNGQQLRSRINDKIKNELAPLRGYKLIRIWEDEIDTFNIKNIKSYE